MCLAIPGKLLSINENDPLMRQGVISFSGINKEISLALLPDATIGDYVIVHAGFAIAILNEEEATKTLEYLKQAETKECLDTGAQQ